MFNYVRLSRTVKVVRLRETSDFRSGDDWSVLSRYIISSGSIVLAPSQDVSYCLSAENISAKRKLDSVREERDRASIAWHEGSHVQSLSARTQFCMYKYRAREPSNSIE